MNGIVYLLHFDPPVAHARHYLGWTQNLGQRLADHRRGAGSPLVAAAVRAGATVELARQWDDVDRHFERRLKNRHETPRMCPVCVAQGLTTRGLLAVAA